MKLLKTTLIAGSLALLTAATFAAPNPANAQTDLSTVNTQKPASIAEQLNAQQPQLTPEQQAKAQAQLKKERAMLEQSLAKQQKAAKQAAKKHTQ